MKKLINKIIDLINWLFFIDIPKLERKEPGRRKLIDIVQRTQPLQIRGKKIRYNNQKIRCSIVKNRKREDGNIDIYIEYDLDKQHRKQWFLNCDGKPDKNKIRFIHGEPIRIIETDEVYKDQNGNTIIAYTVMARPDNQGYDKFDLEPVIPKVSRAVLEREFSGKLKQ